MKIKDLFCPICPHKSSRKTHLDQHIKAVHFELKEFPCTVKGCEYKTKVNREKEYSFEAAYNSCGERKVYVWYNN